MGQYYDVSRHQCLRPPRCFHSLTHVVTDVGRLAVPPAVLQLRQCRSDRPGAWQILADSLPAITVALKTFASILLSFVPHSAEVERLLLDLCGIQGAKKFNLTMEKLRKTGEIAQQLRPPSLSSKGGADRINTDIATDIAMNFTWSPPLARQGPASNNNSLEGPENITPEDFDAVFDKLDQRLKEAPMNSEMVLEDGQEVLDAQVYDFEELERINKGLALVTDVPPTPAPDVESLLMFLGVVQMMALHF